MDRLKKIKYIENKISYGIDYDYHIIRKHYKKLGIPPDYWNPSKLPLETHKYFVGFSERTIGKTTNVLLLGMVMNALYGTIIQYVRQDEKDIAPKATSDLFEVITDPEYKYIEKLTDGVYNTVYYKSRRWYYARADENGKIVDIAENHFMFMCDVMHASNLKSGYNAPLGDIIVFDEFITYNYYPNEFVKFEDLVSTIIRYRRSPIIFMLANTINKESQYFNELDVYEDVQMLGKGENLSHTTEKGTKIYIEWISNEKATAKKRVLNELFFGFKNTQLASITGSDWAIRSYQHIPEDITKYELILRNIYISHNDRLVRISLYNHSEIGLIAVCNKALYTYDDSLILTIQGEIDSRYKIYGDGLNNPRTQKLFKTIWNLRAQNKFYYQTNDLGHFVDNYLNLCKRGV